MTSVDGRQADAQPGRLPLSGVRVLDFSLLMPGPFCTRLLADWGADVTKVEDTRIGDLARTAPPFIGEEGVVYQTLNRGKRGLSVRYTRSEGREIVLRLAERADVLVESFLPGRMARLGFGYDDLRRTNPGLVYASLSAYGQQGPRARQPAHDINILARCGFLWLNARAGETPVVPPVQVADLGAGVLACAAILAALHARQRSGEGAFLDVAMLDAALTWLTIPAALQLAGAERAAGAFELAGGTPCYNVYPTADDRLVAIGALEPTFWRRFCGAVGRPDLVERQYDLASVAEVAGLFRTQSQRHWLELCQTAGVPCDAVVPLSDALADEQVAARDLTARVEHASAGVLVQLVPPVRFGAHELLPAPALGQHSAEILRELGYSDERIRALEGSGIIRQVAPA
jgi:crotonobetainyl-CoA:carnitine CoA-transferase CaiB-like acyl-CoA transferase